jgi:hypothetical protein
MTDDRAQLRRIELHAVDAPTACATESTDASVNDCSGLNSAYSPRSSRAPQHVPQVRLSETPELDHPYRKPVGLNHAQPTCWLVHQMWSVLLHAVGRALRCGVVYRRSRALARLSTGERRCRSDSYQILWGRRGGWRAPCEWAFSAQAGREKVMSPPTAGCQASR